VLMSVFTPSHKPTWLRDVWACLKEQTHQDFEWVVVANGDDASTVASVAAAVAEGDQRVRVVEAPREVVGIGALKRYACDLCIGDVFVEYDHDDLVTPDCLAAVAEAAGRAGPVCFVYSEGVTCTHEGDSVKYDTAFGWRHSPWAYRGREYVVNLHPPVTARSVCEILYAPDHVRAWSRAAYQLAGRHDPKLRVGDDHELVVRTYLTGAEFAKVDRPLYLHRVGSAKEAKTTSQEQVGDIQAQSRATRDKYLPALVREWCRREKLPMLDLGGAHGCPPGYVPVDPNLAHASDGYKCDVFNLPLPPSSVGCFRASDFLEHVPPHDVPRLMNFLYDKLVPGGWILSNTPAVCDDQGRCGRGSYQDPTHVSFWSSNNFWYYTRREQAKYVPEVRCRFQTVRVANYYPSEWHKTHLIPYVAWDAVSLKDDDKHYFPGPREI
jgi:hypothetical protein